MCALHVRGSNTAVPHKVLTPKNNSFKWVFAYQSFQDFAFLKSQDVERALPGRVLCISAFVRLRIFGLMHIFPQVCPETSWSLVELPSPSMSTRLGGATIAHGQGNRFPGKPFRIIIGDSFLGFFLLNCSHFFEWVAQVCMWVLGMLARDASEIFRKCSIQVAQHESSHVSYRDALQCYTDELFLFLDELFRFIESTVRRLVFQDRRIV